LTATTPPAVISALLVVAAYLLGTFPSAVWIARSKGVDITKVGSGNPGASNIARTFGTWWGVLVFVLDGLKGAVPAAAGLLVADRKVAWAMVAASVLGHMFPVTRRFAGGKGVATMGGASFVMQPVVSVVLLGVWGAVRKATGLASLASIAIIIGLPVGAAIRGVAGWELAVIVAVDLVVLARHAGNIERLLRGRELSASRAKR
jgi:glycerol-3-phosphate acyltransferase PlsY